MTCLVFSKGTFLGELDWKPIRYRALLMVSLLTLIPESSRSVLISERVMKAFLLIHLEVHSFIFSVFHFLEGLLYRRHTYTFWWYFLLHLVLDSFLWLVAVSWKKPCASLIDQRYDSNTLNIQSPLKYKFSIGNLKKVSCIQYFWIG